MKCELCHQKNAETVLHRPGKNGRDEELYVCRACAETEAVFGETHGIQVAAMGDMMPPMGNRLPLMPPDGEALPDGEEMPFPEEMQLPPKELLGKLGEVFGQLSEKLNQLDNGPSPERCPKCGMRLEDIRTEAMLGCPTCLKVFRKTVVRILEDLQGSATYCGAPALQFEAQARQKELKAALKAAIDCEDYAAAKAIKAKLAALERGEESADGN